MYDNFRKLLATISLALIFPGSVFSATYYIDYSGGSDANNGLSKAAAWKTHPWYAWSPTHPAYAHAAGDHFIFRGGVTVPAQGNLMLNIQAGGTAGNPDYYGVDQSWFVGGAWSRPVFDAQWQNFNGATDAGGYNVMFFLSGSASYVTIDNLDFTRLSWNGTHTLGQIAAIFEAGGNTGITIQNCYIHNWGHGPTATSGYMTLIKGAEGSEPFDQGNSIVNTIFDGENSTNSTDHLSTGCALYLWGGKVLNSTFRNMVNPMVMSTAKAGWAEIYGNDIGPTWNAFSGSDHDNSIRLPRGGGPWLIHGNYVHDSQSAMMFWGDSAEWVYFFNNVCYRPNSAIFSIDTPNTGGRAYIWNNTLDARGDGIFGIGKNSETGSQAVLSVLNNHFIDPGTMIIQYRPVLAYTNDASNVTMTSATATAQGYTVTNLYRPVSGSVGTVNAGISLLDQVTGINTDLLGVVRPQGGAWDAGAYEYNGAPPPPSVPDKPTNVSPVDGVVNQSTTPTLALSGYSSTAPQVGAQFQVYNGASLVWDSGTLGAVGSVAVPGGLLGYTITYNWHGRYLNSTGWSDYSVGTSFTTASVPSTPTNVLPANGAVNVSLTPTLTLNAYSAGFLPQTGAQFTVMLAGDPIWDSGEIGAVDSVSVPGGNLDPAQTYSWQGRYKNAAGWSGLSALTTFTTTNTAPAGTIQWQASAYSVPEAGPTVVLTATRTGGSNTAIAANWATADGSATAGHDYVAAFGTLNFPDGSTNSQTVTITIINSGDTSTVNRTFTLTLSGSNLGTPIVATVAISMDPPPPIGGIGWDQATYLTAYNAGTVNTKAYRFGGSFGLVGASYSTIDGTARSGIDYASKSGTVSFADGVTNAVTVPVTILNSGQTSVLPRYFFIQLSNPTGGAELSGVSSAMVAISMPSPPHTPSVLIIQNPSSVIMQGGVIVTNQ